LVSIALIEAYLRHKTKTHANQETLSFSNNNLTQHFDGINERGTFNKKKTLNVRKRERF